ncbi:outer membrane beta-barrel domain-containing protein [Aquabacterium sp. A7-Y]|uniref:outer membrane beta-barrel domain-containing protein n=1 Tax=Aquabacterium sp. A7-Y TaxID=1349605 RepID=UPI00223DF622|nr:outer membrane beta-barrel domain-containing protein [Aquabacterium sp. A7-Y]MCW7538589.1 outer membrane beta-barrel domain-containing protein [Aquabacterium sp. A7-Y]
MRLQDLALPLLTTAVLAMAPTMAAAADPQPANEQVVVPEVDRRDVQRPRIPSNDLVAGLFTGIYSTQNFGSSVVTGVRLGYHLTEDFFVEGAYARTQVSDESFRQILPGGVFGGEKETLTYYNLSVGYNLLPGEVFFGSRRAKASAMYLIAGVGSTRFNDQRNQTINVGLGSRVFLADWAALQVDLRDHMFSLDLLGKRQSTHNLELTAGLTFFF